MPNHVANMMKPMNEAATVFLVELALSGEKGFAFENYVPGRDKAGKDWYEWCIKNWGTKWDAYDVNLIKEGLRFYTAWSCPAPIFEAIAQKYPDAEFRVLFADEDIGSNLGVIHIKNGKCTVDLYDDKPREKKCNLLNEIKKSGVDDWLVASDGNIWSAEDYKIEHQTEA